VEYIYKSLNHKDLIKGKEGYFFFLINQQELALSETSTLPSFEHPQTSFRQKSQPRNASVSGRWPQNTRRQ